MKKKINYFILIFLFSLTAISWGQSRIFGKMLDETGNTLAGVRIVVTGYSGVAYSDFDGSFNVKANIGDTITFTYYGMQDKQVKITTLDELSVILQPEKIKMVEEIVVIGYGTKKNKDVTGAVSSVKRQDFNQGIVNSPEQLLQGKVSGVNITSATGEPGANQSIAIRGVSGIRTGSTPLFVIDGFPLDNTSTGGSLNPLNFISSEDIESIDVLKDASATAIYGSRGANGVVLITTRKGKEGKMSVSYSNTFGISNLVREMKVYDADTFRNKVKEIGGTLEDFGGSTNWQREITRAATSQSHNLNMTGGTENINYFASLGYQDQEGIIKNNDLKKISGRINITQKLWEERLKIDLNLNATNVKSERPFLDEILMSALTLNPTRPAYDQNGNVNNFIGNPLNRLQSYSDITTTNRLIANISPSIKILKGLVYKINFGVDNSNATQDVQYLPSIYTLGNFQTGRLESTYTNNYNTLIENYLTYDINFKKHNFSFLAGHSYQNIMLKSRGWSINKFTDNGIDPANNPGLGQQLTLVDNLPKGATVRNELQSYFGRVGYDFDSKYLITATLRADGSSKFGADNKYGIFPAVAVAWKITEEKFMESSSFGNLKLRAGWGKTGNQEIPSKITLTSSSTTVTGGTSYPLTPTGAYPGGTTYDRLANPDLQWEVSTQTNVGLDFSVLSGKLSGTIDAFQKVTNNILLKTKSVDPIQPVSNVWINEKNMEIINKGVEVSLNYKYKTESGFGFGVGGNFTILDNKIKNSPITVIPSGEALGPGLSGSAVNGYVNNQPIGTFYLNQFVGFNSAGQSIYADTDGNGVFSAGSDRIASGSALPNKLYNFNLNVNYLGFDLTFNFNGVAGNKIYDNTENAYFTKARLAKSLNTTEAGTQNTQEAINNSAPVSTRFLKDGSFLRLNNATLGYNLNASKVRLEKWIKTIRLSVTGQNLFVITPYNGYDPEINVDRRIDDVISYGIDYLGYPKSRTFLFGLNVSL